MSLAWRIVGAIIAIIGISMMYMTVFISETGISQIGNMTAVKIPTQADLNAKTPVLIGGAIVMFIGFGVIWFGRKF